MTGPDQVSWLVIDKGWKVASADGEEVGTIDEVLGDRNADIFDGLAVKTSMFRSPRYVQAERVASIERGRVGLELTVEDVERLPEYERAAPQEAILAEPSSLWDRVTSRFRRR
jgi:hypothetical protein